MFSVCLGADAGIVLSLAGRKGKNKAKRERGCVEYKETYFNRRAIFSLAGPPCRYCVGGDRGEKQKDKIKKRQKEKGA